MRVSSELKQVIVAAPDDIDELGHVSNLVYLRYVQDAAKEHSKVVGWDYEAYLRLGAVFVVRKHEIEYLAPTFEGETLTVTTWIENWSAATSVRRTLIQKGDAEVVRATTLWAMVSTESGRPRRIPAELREAFAPKEG